MTSEVEGVFHNFNREIPKSILPFLTEDRKIKTISKSSRTPESKTSLSS